MLNILVPMAGWGARFSNAGYSLPKPLIPINGKPMIEVVIYNLMPRIEHRFIFVCLKSHIMNYKLDEKLRQCSPDCRVIAVDKVTEGACCTALLAKSLINNNDPLMIANCDQWVDIDINDYIRAMGESDGLIMTMWANHPKWSYVALNDKNIVTKVVEKEVISNEATVGIYNFRRGSDFVSGAKRMINKNLRVNNEFYIAPVYNELILQGKIIKVYNVGKLMENVYGLGTPDDLTQFLRLDASRKST